MAGSRLSLIVPPPGQLLVLGGQVATLAGLDPARTIVVQGFRPDHDALAAQGFRVVTAPEGPADGAVVVMPRARADARARIAAAAASLPPGAPLWIDGQNTDGIDGMLRELRGLVPIDEVQSRGHGKIARITIPPGAWLPADWAGATRRLDGGFVTAPGVFSADGPDPASELLAAHLPDRLPTRIVDLGAGEVTATVDLPGTPDEILATAG